MRCKACNSEEAVWDGHDYYCEECLEAIDETLSEFDLFELEEFIHEE
jgi:uncharacterized Zn ribbon protein